MKKTLSILLALILVVSLTAVIFASANNDTVVQLDDTSYSAALGLNLGNVSGTWAVYYGATANDNGVNLANVYAQSVLSGRPAGLKHRIGITINAVPNENVVYLTDAGIAAAKAAMDTYFAAISANSGVPRIWGIDVNFDSMFGTSSSNSMRAAYINYWYQSNPAIYQQIVADERYATEIRPLLEERGFWFMSWEEGSTKTELSILTASEWSGYGPTQTDVDANRAIWDAAMAQRLAQYMEEIVYEPLQEYYPGALVNVCPTITIGDDVTVAAMGETVAIDAGEAPAGMEFDKWVLTTGSAAVTIADENSAQTTVKLLDTYWDQTWKIPCGNVGLTATWKEACDHANAADDGDCTTAVICPDCSGEVTPAKTAHTPEADDGDCTTAVGCADCDQEAIPAKTAHTPEADDGDCTTAVGCADCDQVAIEAEASHVGGTATCSQKAVCDNCGTSYGELVTTHTPAAGAEIGWYQCEDCGVWYYVNEAGSLQTGWAYVHGTWYYMDENGSMVTGWVNVEGFWYYMDETGAMQTGWLELSGAKYYLAEGGAKQIGWVKVDDVWYFMDETGAMQTGWVTVNNYTYYLDETTGVMQTGWIELSGEWYYMEPGGAMQTGWILLGEYWYYLDETTGAWIIL